MNVPLTPTGVADALVNLWNRAPTFLWASTIACFAVTLILALSEYLAGTFPATPFWVALCFFAAAFIFATARSYEERSRGALFIVPIGPMSFFNVTRQPDSSHVTQIQLHLDIFNRASVPVMVVHADLASPRTEAEVLDRRIENMGHHADPDGWLDVDGRGRFRVIFMVRGDLGDKIKQRGVIFSVFGSRGRKHKVAIKRLRAG